MPNKADWSLLSLAWRAVSIRFRCVRTRFPSAHRLVTTLANSEGSGYRCRARWKGFGAAIVFGMLLAAESTRAATAQIRLEVTDLNSNVITTVNLGESFLLRGFVADLRAQPIGVFSAYLNVAYSPASAVNTTGEITYSAPYTVGTSADLSDIGAIANIGSYANSLTPTGASERLQFSVRMQALAPGLVTFTGSFSEGVRYAVLLYGLTGSVPTEELQFVNTTIMVSGSPPRIDQIEVGTDGTQLTLSGPQHATIQVQTLTHLTNGWENVGNAVSLGAAGTARFVDTGTTNHPIRFYRAYQP